MSSDLDVVLHFRRRLIIRLMAAGLFWAIAAGGVAYLVETERLDETLVDQAALEARTLEQQTHGVKEALDALIDKRAASNRDFFILVELYGTDRTPTGESVIKEYEFVEKKFDRGGHVFPAPGNSWYAKRVIDGTPYLQVMVPLTDEDGKPIGWFEGIYRISADTVEALGADIATITGLVVAVVLGTAGLLYPLMVNLQNAIVDKARDLLQANLDTLKVLGNAIAKRDSDTNDHNFRVTLYSIRLAEHLRLNPAAIRRLIKGSFLHDVGKIAIPDAILLKPGKLDADEFTTMKTHVNHGLDIIASSIWLQDAGAVVGCHHEKMDGTGYPAGISHDAIPLAARIFAVADVFDALTSKRPYKDALPATEALTILKKGSGQHFDPALVAAAHEVLPPMHTKMLALGSSDLESYADTEIRRYFSI